MVWNILPQISRSANVGFQNLQVSLVKTASIITKLVDSLGASGKNDLVEQGVDASALFGHANKQLVQSRRTALKRRVWSSLCAIGAFYRFSVWW